MKIDNFFAKRGILNWCLLPFSWIYWIIFFIKFYCSLLGSKKVAIPVICIGNIVVGGTGKTPVALALAQLLKNSGKRIAFLSRGYGGNLAAKGEVIKVDNKKHKALEVGDEPLILSKKADTYIAVDRYKAACEAVKDGNTVLIMDDGLQNNTLHKDCNILLLDSQYIVGNGFLLPAGPMREPLFHVLYRINLIILIGEKKQNDKAVLMLKKYNFKGPIFYAASKNTLPISVKKVGQCVLFTAIAKSYRVVEALRAFNVQVFHHFAYPDHYCFDVKDIKEAIQYAKNAKLPLITTLKDIVKIPEEYKKNFVVLKHNIELDGDGILNYIFTSIFMR